MTDLELIDRTDPGIRALRLPLTATVAYLIGATAAIGGYLMIALGYWGYFGRGPGGMVVLLGMDALFCDGLLALALGWTLVVTRAADHAQPALAKTAVTMFALVGVVWVGFAAAMVSGPDAGGNWADAARIVSPGLLSIISLCGLFALLTRRQVRPEQVRKVRTGLVIAALSPQLTQGIALMMFGEMDSGSQFAGLSFLISGLYFLIYIDIYIYGMAALLAMPLVVTLRVMLAVLRARRPRKTPHGEGVTMLSVFAMAVGVVLPPFVLLFGNVFKA